MNPKTTHQIWIGPNAPPLPAMASWVHLNPTWGHKLHSNIDLNFGKWRLQPQIDAMKALGRWEGVADLMRLEIIHAHGGLYLDADFTCVRPLDGGLPDEFLCYENETAKPGLICNGAYRLRAGHSFLEVCIQNAEELTEADIAAKLPWQLTGPLLFTLVAKGFPELPVIPARYFLPKHYSGTPAPGTVKPYASHSWSTTLQH